MHPPETALVGREREQQQLGEALTAACSGQGRLVLVSGEAGIGKTTLVRDLVDQARTRGCLVLSGGCYDLTTTPPYGPWIEAIGSYKPAGALPAIPDWFVNPDELERLGSQQAIFDEVRAFLGSIAAVQPLVFVLEDLHWSDPASLEALRYLGRALEDVAILLVVTYRDDELTRRHDLYQLLPLIIRESRAQRIHLNRLDQGALHELVAQRYELDEEDRQRLIAYVAQRSEGNPFFAEEILHGLEDGQVLRPTASVWALGDLAQSQVPSLLRQVLDARLANLPPESRAALQVAAVIGQEVPFELWETVSDLDEAQLESVVSVGLEMRLIEPAPGHTALHFRHALLREALYESLFMSRRRTLHRRVGEALAETASPDPGAVAHHFRQAADARALGWLVQAGLRARRSTAWITAAECFERAALLLEDEPSRVRERGWLLFYAVFVLRDSGELRLFDLLDEAERLATEAGDRVLAASIRFHRGIRLAMGGRVRRGIEELRAATAAFESFTEVEHVAPVDELAPAVLQRLVSREAPVPARASPSKLVSEDPSQARAPIFSQCILATWLAQSGQYHEALEVGEVIVREMAEYYGEDHLRMIPGASGHFALGLAYGAMGRPDDSRREFSLASRGYELFGDPVMTVFAQWADLMLVVMPFRTDQLAERSRSESEAEEKWTRTADLPGTQPEKSPALLAIDLIEGRWAEAKRQAQSMVSANIIAFIQGGIATLGILARNQGNPDLAWEQVLKLFSEGTATEPGDSYFLFTHAMQRLAVELALDAGDLALAWEWIDAHGHWQEWSGAVLWRGDHLLLQARCHHVAGYLDQARDHAQAALEHASEPRQPLVLIAAHRLLGELAIQNKRYVEADEHLQESLALAEACTAPFEQAQTLLVLAELNAVTGKPDMAWQQLSQVRAICTPLEALPTLRRATDIAARLSVRRGQPVHPAGLTPREVEVLQLVAQGMTNAETGDVLFISPRTVAQHLRSVYNKLGVDSRVEATRFAVENGLVDSPST